MSNGASHEEQYQSWLRSQEIKGRDVPLEGEIRPFQCNCNEDHGAAMWICPMHGETGRLL